MVAVAVLHALVSVVILVRVLAKKHALVLAINLAEQTVLEPAQVVRVDAEQVAHPVVGVATIVGHLAVMHVVTHAVMVAVAVVVISVLAVVLAVLADVGVVVLAVVLAVLAAVVLDARVNVVEPVQLAAMISVN